jgi:hypothetical protein
MPHDQSIYNHSSRDYDSDIPHARFGTFPNVWIGAHPDCFGNGVEMFLDYFALVVLLLGLVAVFYTFIYIHDIPYEIAKQRNHPQKRPFTWPVG